MNALHELVGAIIRLEERAGELSVDEARTLYRASDRVADIARGRIAQLAGSDGAKAAAAAGRPWEEGV